jgi:hypothetical protein
MMRGLSSFFASTFHVFMMILEINCLSLQAE